MATKAIDLNEYGYLFDTCLIKKEKYTEVDRIVTAIAANKARYEGVGNPIGIPWYFIGIIHSMEADLRFDCHLHNGDPLIARTVQVPKNRPINGVPPFTWEASAIDALTYDGSVGISNWDIPNMLYRFERYNGIGYLSRGIKSPYLWSFSNQYTKGKFVKDGVFDPEAVSDQCGAAVLLRRMVESHIIPLGEVDRLTLIKNIGLKVRYNAGNTPDDKAFELQTLLNSIGLALKIDGLAGKNTSTAFQKVAGTYLEGDPRLK